MNMTDSPQQDANITNSSSFDDTFEPSLIPNKFQLQQKE